MPSRVRITVLKKAFYPKIAAQYLAEACEPCPLLTEKQTFLSQGRCGNAGGLLPLGLGGSLQHLRNLARRRL